MRYFSDREGGERPRNIETINDRVWRAIQTKKRTLIKDGSFGASFPRCCQDDSAAVVGTNEEDFYEALRGEIPDFEKGHHRYGAPPRQTSPWSELDTDHHEHSVPPTTVILDVIEFCWKYVGDPIPVGGIHTFYGHRHLKFDKKSGQNRFREHINLIFCRNGLVYELKSSGQVERPVPTELRKVYAYQLRTPDAELNRMLETAKEKFLNPRVEIRMESLKYLWDAWERLKTIGEQGGDKKMTILVTIRKISVSY